MTRPLTPLTLEEIEVGLQVSHPIIAWTPKGIKALLETARMLYAVKEAIQITAIHHMANCDMDSMGQCCACKVDEALRPFQEGPK